jgi:hypothetical protein
VQAQRTRKLIRVEQVMTSSGQQRWEHHRGGNDAVHVEAAVRH